MALSDDYPWLDGALGALERTRLAARPDAPTFGDAARGIRDWWGGMNNLQRAGLINDYAGLLGDIQMYREQPETNTWANYALTGLGVLPLVPPMAGMRSTIRGAERKAFPGIYDDPKELVRQAEEMVPPEDPMLGRLFDTSREEMREIAQRPGTHTGILPGAAANPKGSAAAEKVMKPANTSRLVAGLTEARESPLLAPGMEGWYVMDPVYHRMLELYGDEDLARQAYKEFNTMTAMASSNADVITELNRGTAARQWLNEGEFEDFMQYGGLPQEQKSRLVPRMESVRGHPAHSTAHGRPWRGFVETGESQMKSPKVPLYMQASSVPELGFQTNRPVGDAHWARATGLADARTSADWGKSVSNPEAAQLGPWWASEVAERVGLESVPAQALQWGLTARQTGVESAIGAPKLEILAGEIAKAARRMGISPEEARDLILMGKAHTGG